MIKKIEKNETETTEVVDVEVGTMEDHDSETSNAETSSAEESCEGELENSLFKGAKAATSKTRNQGYTEEKGILTIVYAKTGKRLIFSSEVMGKLNNPTTVQVAFLKDKLLIGEKLPENDSLYKTKKSGLKHMIYCTALIEEIIDEYGLSFGNRTSTTFLEVEYGMYEKSPVASIKMK
ncbi:hypothetical protein [Parasporobacterium paucivorans]|nr:hypothetical protein [Parasporobacterium paucivorans]